MVCVQLCNAPRDGPQRVHRVGRGLRRIAAAFCQAARTSGFAPCYSDNNASADHHSAQGQNAEGG